MYVDISDLIGNPGRTDKVVATVPRAAMDAPEGAWGPSDEALVSPIELDLRLEMLVDGLFVHGTVSFTLALACARCLREVRTRHDMRAHEMFVDPAGVDEEVEPGYELLTGEQAIDLEPMLTDTLGAALPLRVLCREECQGLCPECGTDLNVEDCGHRHEARIDPRWAPLAELDLPPG